MNMVGKIGLKDIFPKKPEANIKKRGLNEEI